MMILLVIFAFLFNACASNGVTIGASVKENNWQGLTHGDYNDPYYTHTDHRDHPNEPICRPCLIQDEDCIRRVFTSAFNCLATHGPVPELYLVDTLDIDMPHSNLTFTINEAKIKGLNSGKIKDFYINKETDRFVLEVVFDSVIVFSPRTVVSHYRRGKEPIQSCDFSIVEYKSLSLTLTISNIGQALWKAHVYAYLNNADVPYKLGPGITESKDRKVSNNNKKRLDNLVLSVKEALLTQGSLFMSVYLQSNICDFRYQ